MDEIWTRVVENLSHRVGGPLNFRFVMQPVMALIFATIDGFKDAKTGKDPYLWRLFTDPDHRADALKHGWKSVGKVFVLAIVLDLVFQIRELGTVFPGELLAIALLLAILPYLLLRGPVCRLLQKLNRPQWPKRRP